MQLVPVTKGGFTLEASTRISDVREQDSIATMTVWCPEFLRTTPVELTVVSPIGGLRNENPTNRRVTFMAAANYFGEVSICISQVTGLPDGAWLEGK